MIRKPQTQLLLFLALLIGQIAKAQVSPYVVSVKGKVYGEITTAELIEAKGLSIETSNKNLAIKKFTITINHGYELVELRAIGNQFNEKMISQIQKSKPGDPVFISVELKTEKDSVFKAHPLFFEITNQKNKATSCSSEVQAYIKETTKGKFSKEALKAIGKLQAEGITPGARVIRFKMRTTIKNERRIATVKGDKFSARVNELIDNTKYWNNIVFYDIDVLVNKKIKRANPILIQLTK